MSAAVCPGSCLLAPSAACGILEVLEVLDLDSTPTRVIPCLENPHGCFCLELPGLGAEVLVWELLFSVAEGDGLGLLLSSSGCFPPSTSLALSPRYRPSQLCWVSC